MVDQSKVLTHLIDVCKDARNFYKSAAAQAEDDYIESVFYSMAMIRSNIIVDLTNYMEASYMLTHGRKPAVTDIATDRPARHTPYIYKNINFSSDRDLVIKLEEAEDRALEEFHKALAENIPPQVKAVLSQQMGTLQQTHDYMKGLKERLGDS